MAECHLGVRTTVGEMIYIYIYMTTPVFPKNIPRFPSIYSEGGQGVFRTSLSLHIDLPTYLFYLSSFV